MFDLRTSPQEDSQIRERLSDLSEGVSKHLRVSRWKKRHLWNCNPHPVGPFSSEHLREGRALCLGSDDRNLRYLTDSTRLVSLRIHPLPTANAEQRGA